MRRSVDPPFFDHWFLIDQDLPARPINLSPANNFLRHSPAHNAQWSKQLRPAFVPRRYSSFFQQSLRYYSRESNSIPHLRSMAPPTGPRASRDRQAPRASRGGISKRRGANKTDRDGDVSMDAPAGGSAPRGPRGGRGSNKGTRTSSRIAQNVKLYSSEGGQGSKSHFNRVTLKVHGVRESKAASNSDGGRRALLEFLEKKASKTKKIVIGKVCYPFINSLNNYLPRLEHC